MHVQTVGCLRVTLAHDRIQNFLLWEYAALSRRPCSLRRTLQREVTSCEGEYHADNKGEDTRGSTLHGNPSCYVFRNSVGDLWRATLERLISWVSLHRLLAES